MSISNKNWLQLLFIPFLLVTIFIIQGQVSPVKAASKTVLNAEIQDTLQVFKNNVRGAGAVLNDAEGILVFPRVYQGGLFAVGGQYGKGALLVKNHISRYYRIASGSLGPQLGGQRKAIIIAFFTPQALQSFQNSSGWKIGADASVAVLVVGAEGSLTSDQIANKPVVAFVLDQKGLMYNLSLQGTRIFPMK
jgi:lipid-binding SYLF domain-containing protein